MPKLPAIHLYPGDWLRDTIAGCSLAAQGLWLRMMFIAHDSEDYGYLTQNKKPISSEAIAQRCGCSLETYNFHLKELIDAGVASVTDRYIVYSRRMVRDSEIREHTAKRVRKHRKTKKVNNANVTPLSFSSSVSYICNTHTDDVSKKRKGTYEEVCDYCLSLKLDVIDAEYLFNHWEENGWTNKGKPIKDWKKTVVCWKHMGYLPSQKNGNGRTKPYQKTGLVL